MPLNSLINGRRRRTPFLNGVFVLGLFFAFSAFALDPARSLFQYNLRSWTHQNGLPANGVNAIAQTKDGYLWLGTPVGLVRFDGVEFKPLNMGQLRSSIVTGLSGSKRGGLWFSLESGAFGFCDGTEVFPRGKTEWGGVALTVHGVLESKKEELWIAGQNLAGKLTKDLNYEPILNTPGGKDFYDVDSVYEDSQGRVWLGTTGRGLFYSKNGVLTNFSDPLVEKLTIRALVEDKGGNLWIGTEKGLLCYDTNFQRRKDVPFPWYETRALLADRQGAVWAGTSGGGLVRFLPGGASAQLQKANGLTDDVITALAEDREGNIWIGTRNGLNQLTDVKIPTLSKTEGLTADVNISVCASRKGGLWIATSEGVTYFDGWPHPSSANAGLRNGYIKRVFESRSGELYLINGSMDIEVLSGGKVVARYPNQSWPTAFTEDDRGVIAAVGGDLYRVSTNSFEPYPFTGQKPLKCWIYNLAMGADGSLWSVSAEGICRVKNGTTEVLTGPDPLGGAKATWLCEDSDGIAWAGLESGIARIKNGKVRTITRDNGLFDNLIYAIVPDDHGALWVSSGRGFFRVSRRNLNDFADGKIDHVQCIAYDGLEAVKTFERNQQEVSGCKTLDGKIWFPTALGVVMINPTNVPINRIAPAVYVHKVNVNGKEMDVNADQVVARPGSGDLEFYYTALSYVAPQKIRFRYKLEGYDKDWVEAGDRRLAFYTNLKPGKYAFHVVAANADGVWNNSGDSVEIELQPHYYQTVWFYSICGVLSCAGLVGIYSWRLRHLHRKQRALQQTRDLLETKVAERTAALADSNASLVKEVQQRVKAQAELEGQKTALEKEIEERKRMEVEVERIHRQLMDASRQAGQAEVASGVLHNVGNVLNSVNVSTTLVSDRLRKLQISNLARAAKLMEEHADDLGRFVTTDEKGRRLPQYLGRLARHLGQEQDDLLNEVKELADNVEHIKEIVAMQQTYATLSGVAEKAEASELVESALKMHADSYRRHSIAIERDYEDASPILVDRHKALQILINILKNAKHACEESGQPAKKVLVRIAQHRPDRVTIEIADNGIGIAPENLTRIFSHGFTTRKNGHGFGLHSAALAAKEMGGALTGRSEGAGKGATFIVELPICPKPPHESAPSTSKEESRSRLPSAAAEER